MFDEVKKREFSHEVLGVAALWDWMMKGSGRALDVLDPERAEEWVRDYPLVVVMAAVRATFQSSKDFANSLHAVRYCAKAIKNNVVHFHLFKQAEKDIASWNSEK